MIKYKVYKHKKGEVSNVDQPFQTFTLAGFTTISFLDVKNHPLINSRVSRPIIISF